MSDFETILREIIEEVIPALSGKIYPGAVPAKTPLPYAAYTTPNEEPIRTKDGIVGYVTTFEVAVLHSVYGELKAMKQLIIESLDSQIIDGQRCQYKASEKKYFSDYRIHGYLITFKIS